MKYTIEYMQEKILARLDDGRGRATYGPNDFNSTACSYRSRTGNKCAVGCLIDDDHYDADAEGTTTVCLGIESGKWTGRCSSNLGAHQRAHHLAQMLNNQGIPATEEIHNFLNSWQERHDLGTNWDGTTYVGPRCIPK